MALHASTLLILVDQDTGVILVYLDLSRAPSHSLRFQLHIYLPPYTTTISIIYSLALAIFLPSMMMSIVMTQPSIIPVMMETWQEKYFQYLHEELFWHSEPFVKGLCLPYLSCSPPNFNHTILKMLSWTQVPIQFSFPLPTPPLYNLFTLLFLFLYILPQCFAKRFKLLHLSSSIVIPWQSPNI